VGRKRRSRRIRQPPMPDATLKRLIMPTQHYLVGRKRRSRRIRHKNTRTLLRLPYREAVFLPSFLYWFSYCRFCDRYLDI
ncbi:hypothetical protein, partial [Escherichia sp. E14V5]|uniref:hypothetical protein n=1 Tax=Escherichia sp. E14V5 TaxID=2478974 RepID=UPI00196AD415